MGWPDYWGSLTIVRKGARPNLWHGGTESVWVFISLWPPMSSLQQPANYRRESMGWWKSAPSRPPTDMSRDFLGTLYIGLKGLSGNILITITRNWVGRGASHHAWQALSDRTVISFMCISHRYCQKISLQTMNFLNMAKKEKTCLLTKIFLFF
jgi:hypothetical protein